MFSFISKIQSFIIKHIYFILGVCFLFGFLYSEYIKRQIYPYFLGIPTDTVLEISTKDNIQETDSQPFVYSYTKEPVLLKPRKSYSVTARVFDMERYDTFFEKFYHGYDEDRMIYNNFAPLDLVLVFGNLADLEVLSHYDFKHRYRGSSHKCHPCYKGEKEFYNNYHIIPASVSLRKAFETVLKNDIIYLRGYLVDVSIQNKPYFNLHTGIQHNAYHENQFAGGKITGMCFILYVNEMILNGRIYH